MDRDTTIGRIDLLASVTTLIERTATGVGQLVCVCGAIGIGKTTLLHHVADCARSAGLRVLMIPNDPISDAMPYAPWMTLLEAAGVRHVTSTLIAGLRAESGTPGHGWSRGHLVAGVIEAFTALAVHLPRCLVCHLLECEVCAPRCGHEWPATTHTVYTPPSQCGHSDGL